MQQKKFRSFSSVFFYFLQPGFGHSRLGHQQSLEYFLHISSSYAKILGETNFPRSGSKAKDGEKREKKREERLNDGDNNGQATHGVRKPPGPIWSWDCFRMGLS